MATAIKKHEGNVVDYVALADHTMGDIVLQGDLIGVVQADCKTGQTVGLAIKGGYSFPKAVGAIGAGVPVYWIVASSNITATAGSNKLIGKCETAALSADTHASIILIP